MESLLVCVGWDWSEGRGVGGGEGGRGGGGGGGGGRGGGGVETPRSIYRGILPYIYTRECIVIGEDTHVSEAKGECQ